MAIKMKLARVPATQMRSIGRRPCLSESIPMVGAASICASAFADAAHPTARGVASKLSANGSRGSTKLNPRTSTNTNKMIIQTAIRDEATGTLELDTVPALPICGTRLVRIFSLSSFVSTQQKFVSTNSNHIFLGRTAKSGRERARERAQERRAAKRTWRATEIASVNKKNDTRPALCQLSYKGCPHPESNRRPQVESCGGRPLSTSKGHARKAGFASYGQGRGESGWRTGSGRRRSGRKRPFGSGSRAKGVAESGLGRRVAQADAQPSVPRFVSRGNVGGSGRCSADRRHSAVDETRSERICVWNADHRVGAVSRVSIPGREEARFDQSRNGREFGFRERANSNSHGRSRSSGRNQTARRKPIVGSKASRRARIETFAFFSTSVIDSISNSDSCSNTNTFEIEIIN